MVRWDLVASVLQELPWEPAIPQLFPAWRPQRDETQPLGAPQTVFGGLVWILIASSLVPLPLMQGWVMFVSVFCFVATTTLLVLYMMGAHGGEASWVTLDAAYHCTAALFYLSASVLEALATIIMHDGFTYKYYHENISAVVFSYVATLLYVVHAVFSLIRWKSS